MPTAKTAAPSSAAAEAEATEAPTTFEHAGISFVVPPPLDMPLDLLEADTEMEAVRLIVGEEAWAAYRATRPTIRDFQALAERVTEAAGQGN